ncbi:MAG: lectin-like protein [Pseudomonadota bacterium]
MTSGIGSILPPGLKDQLVAIKQADRRAQEATNKLATGLDVNSAVDNPQNFFTSQFLQFRSNDLSRVIDGIGQSIRTVQVASDGLEAVLDLIDQAEALILEGLTDLFPATDEEVDERAIDYIRARNGDKGYFPTLGNFYQNTTDFATWENARINAENAGLNGVPEVTGHLATITSQEENDVVFGLLTATSWLGGSDDEVEGVWRWVVGPEAGQQFWQGLSTGSAVNGSYENWAPGEPNQFFGPGNPENFAHLRADGLWNDLPNNSNLNYIIEWGGDLFVQNPDVNVSAAAMDTRDDYLDILQQIDRIAIDANYRGIGLLEGDDMETIFNEDRTSTLVTEGIDATTNALGLVRDNFISKSEMTKILDDLDEAREVLRNYGRTLQNDLGTITNRLDFTRNVINVLDSGSDDLTVGDQNALGAELLAIQTRQAIQFSTLAFSANVPTVATLL